MKNICLYLVNIGFLILLLPAKTSAQATDHKTLIVIFDGLRKDYITPNLMPNLYRFGQKGSIGNYNHSIFPTVTRVNSPSIFTGTYPHRHGILGNSVHLPELLNYKVYNTGDADHLFLIAKESNGQLLTTTSLGEILSSHGKSMMVFSSGSTGQALLQNHKVSSGAIINPDLILPSYLKKDLFDVIGEPVFEGNEEQNKHTWIVNAFSHSVLNSDGPEVSTLWFSDPDGAAHTYGIGSAESLHAIKFVDQQFGKVLAEIENTRLSDSINIIVTTDHGFVTHQGEQNLSDFLIKKGFKASKSSDDIIVAGGAVFVKNKDTEVIKNIISALQAQNWVGAIFTKAESKGEAKGWVKGTLSFETIFWDHPSRTADILVDVNWQKKSNDKGYEGFSFAGGVAGHGSSSPYEIQIPLIVFGPDFISGKTSNLPTANVDIMPTILHLNGIPIPEFVEGRVLNEFQNLPKPIQ